MGDAGDAPMKTAPRFLADQPLARAAIASVSGAELHHLRDLVRLDKGARVILIDPADGGQFAGRVASVAGDRAMVEIEAPIVTPRRIPIILAMALIRAPRMDFIVEKAVELGATEIWPIVAARSQMDAVGAERMRRWNRLAAEAAKQSLAPRVPPVRMPRRFAELVDAPHPGATALICAPGAPSIVRVLDGHRPRELILLCGPEGGFDPDELEAAARAGFVAAGLGASRLRSETAALAALAIAAAALDAEGGS
jgi:16S rRNA (uracil1498-N3)-methyltransferase